MIATVEGTSRRSGPARIEQLDALLGMAALCVVLNHYVQVVPETVRQAAQISDLSQLEAWASLWTWLRFTPLRLMINGQAAVMVFFVLSGFVLFASLQAQPRISWTTFLIKRFSRIYVPFAVVIIAAAAAYQIAHPVPSAASSEWLNGLLMMTMTYSLPAHLLMTGEPDGMTLNPVIWTLIHEMRVALFIPAIFALCRAAGAVKTLLLCTMISVMASFSMPGFLSGSWQNTFHFLWMFVAGGALAMHRMKIVATLNRLPRMSTLGLWALAAALLLAGIDRVWSDLLVGLGACLVIALCLSPNLVTRTLNTGLPRWLGRISYSLYLVHLPILIVALGAGAPLIALPLLLALTFVVSDVMFRVVEAPAQRLASSFAKWLPTIRQPFQAPAATAAR
ncbi:acyltransferase family protein [Teichococcus wenyumeiae]|nr:acyltransferase [Pseudoroseomonas wenyumeiae]